MKLINIATGETIAQITTNRSLTIEDVIDLMKWKIDSDGYLFDDCGCVGHYDDLELEV